MAESVGKVQLDLEINPNSIRREMGSVKEAFSSGMKKPFTDMNNFIKNSMTRMAEGFRSMVPGAKVAQDAEDMSSKFGGSISKMQKYLDGLQNGFDKTQDKISGVNAELAELDHQRDKIMQDIAGTAFPLSGLTREETIDLLINENTELRKLDVQIASLQAKMQPWIEKNQQARGEIEQLRAAIEQLEKSTGRLAGTTAQSGEAFKLAEKAAKKTGGTLITQVTQEVTKTNNAFLKLATSMQKAFMRVLRQVFIFAVLYKAIRGFMDYMGSALKTNQAFMNSLNQVKTNLQVAFMPIYQAVLPALQSLMNWLAVATTYVASFFSALFGKSYQQSFAAAQALNAAKKSMEGYGKAAKKTLGALAGFDEIHILKGPDEDAGGGGGAAGPELVAPPVDTTAFEQSILGFRQRLIDSFKGLGNIWGPEVAAMFAPFREGWQNLLNNTLIPMKDFFLYDFLVPIGKGIYETFVPIFAEVIPWAIQETGKWWLWLTNVINDFWTVIIKPVFELIREIVLDTLEIIRDLWNEYGGKLLNNISDFMQSLRDIWDLLWTEILEPIIVPFLDMLREVWDESLKDLVYQLGDLILKLVNGAFEIWNKFIAPIINWLIKKMAPTVTSVFKLVTDVIGTALKTIIDVAKGIIKALGGIIDFIVGIFTGDWKRAWEGVKTIFTGIFDSLKAIVKGVINIIIDALNFFIRSINKIHFNIPDWVPGFGGKEWGFNVPTISHLARGGIVDQPTLAMIGERRKKEAVLPLDQNTGWMDDLAAKIATVMSTQGGTSTLDGPLQINLYLNNSVFGKAIIKSLREAARQGGGLVIPV